MKVRETRNEGYLGRKEKMKTGTWGRKWGNEGQNDLVHFRRLVVHLATRFTLW
jgi:hypothetical protein